MSEEQELYDGEPKEKWMNGLKETDDYNVRHLLAIFARLGIPKSMLDVGCGTGAMVRAARSLGVEAYGVDQLVDETWDHYNDWFFHKNLVNLFILPDNKKVELVTSFEVAEHIHTTAHPTILSTCIQNFAGNEGNYILFSAARPGQGGTGHVFLRDPEYWHHEYEYHGMKYDDNMTMILSHIASVIYTPLTYMYTNLQVYRK